MPIGINKVSRNSQIGSDIPDNVVSREPDDASLANSSLNEGLEFSVSQNWKDFQAKLSNDSGTASDENAIIERASDNTEVASIDISNKTSNDVITFTGVNLSSGQTYYIYARSSNSRARGADSDPTFPYTSGDGNLSISAGYQDGSTFQSFAWRFITIGNINL